MTQTVFYTLARPGSTRVTDRGSRFYAFACPVADRQAVQDHLSELRQQHPDASHHCYAWRLDPDNASEYTQDDGEPSGTAGQPVLNAIRSAGLINVLTVVVRYFGGTKLGKPGLIRAYRQAAVQVLAQSEAVPIQALQQLRIRYPYHHQKWLEQLIHTYGLQVDGQSYDQQVTLTVSCPEQHYPQLSTRLAYAQQSDQQITYTPLQRYYGGLTK